MYVYVRMCVRMCVCVAHYKCVLFNYNGKLLL